MKAAESFEYAQVHPVIDAAIAKSLREKPDLQLVAELYNRIPLDTVLLKETGLEVFRQTVQAMEDRKRVELHPVEYLAMLLNFIQRLVQSDHLNEAEANATKALNFAREGYAKEPLKYNDALASSLETCAMIASDLGKLEECRDARREAIQLLRATPGHERTLAQCLSNQSGTLQSLGDFDGALKHSEEV